LANWIIKPEAIQTARGFDLTANPRALAKAPGQLIALVDFEQISPLLTFFR